MASLAGGVLLCCFPAAFAATGNRGEMPPIPETQLYSAIQSAFPAGAVVDNTLPLRLSSELAETEERRESPVWQGADDTVLALRAATMLSPSVEEEAIPGAMADRSPAGLREPPLRLSQLMGAQMDVPRNRGWATLPEVPMQLRPSRGLAMPGVAGVGRPPVQGLGVGLLPPLADQDGELAGDGIIKPLPLRPAALVRSDDNPADTGIGGSGWEIPPIRWGGSVGYSLQKSSSGSSSSSESQGLFTNLNASSYIYAPWFATVTGRLGFTSSSSSSSSAISGGGDSNQAMNVVGGGEVNMFSSSRFPFRAYFDRSDSRTSGSIVTQDYVSTRFGLSQNYRAEDNLSSGNFMLDRSAVETSDGRKDSVTALSGSYSTQTGPWQHNLNGRYSLGQREGTGEMARLMGFNTSHNANISDNANLSATVNYSDSNLRTSDSAGGLYSNRGRYLQAYAYGSWMPEFDDLDDLPLTLNGSLRYGSQETTFGSAQTSAQTVGGNLSALYRFSKNLTASLNTAINHISLSDGNARTISLVGSNVNYVGNALSFGNFSYNWNVGGSANWQSGAGEVPASSLLGASATHSLARVYQPGAGQSLSLSLSQSLNATNSQMVGSSESLSNNLSANYGMYFGERFSGSITGMFSDVYTTGVNAQHYKNVNLGLVGMGQLSQQSSLNLNLMFNWSDQTNKTMDSYGVPQTMNSQRMTLNGSANYSHMRFAGVRGLRYNVLFAADTRLRDDRLYGNFNTEQDRSRFSLTNRLDYAIGLLNFRLSLTNNDLGGKKNALLFFQVTRQIGSY